MTGRALRGGGFLLSHHSEVTRETEATELKLLCRCEVKDEATSFTSVVDVSGHKHPLVGAALRISALKLWATTSSTKRQGENNNEMHLAV